MASPDVFELELDFENPYKQTKLYIKDGKAFFGIWQPLDVQIDGDEERITVQRGQEGQLDLFAFTVYGTRRLWRVIAQVNLIDYPPKGVVVSMTLIIPKPANVRAALLATITSQQVMVN